MTRNGLHNFSSAGIFKTFPAARIALFFVLCALLLACSRIVLKHKQLAMVEQWPQWGGDAQRTHCVAAAMNMPPELLWSRNATSAIGRSLIGMDASVIYGTKDGRIECIDLENGKKSGHIKIRGNFESTCAYYDSSLLILRRIGQPSLQRVSMQNGKIMWLTLVHTSLAEPLIVDSCLCLTTTRGRFECYDLKDGSRKWSVELTAPSLGGAAFSDGLFVLGDDRGTVSAYDRSSRMVWQTKVDGASVSAPAISDSTVFFGALNDRFYALNLQDGSEKWRFQAGGKLYNGAAVNDDCVIFGCSDHLMYCLHKTTGALLWSFKSDGVVSTAPLILNNVVFVGTLNKKFYALSLDKGEKMWEYETAGRIRTDPVYLRGRVVVASEDKTLYCFGNR